MLDFRSFEIGESVIFSSDSEHVLDVILGTRCSDADDGKPAFCMDDANYNFKHTNTAFIIVPKLSLGPVPDIAGNAICLWEVEARPGRFDRSKAC